ncbi:ABC transporter permease [Cellulomonas sp. P24]|uniref:ABC transporter permease n=1 Tax=Cellulomonas sp. P24 TaxID=2885206 RepID=UPI00216B17C8|nr:ABC transporter permease [Cellulomonas sp. P24]MCR6492498.1 ABC transporter permease [Cellulomonas sp. P24]
MSQHNLRTVVSFEFLRVVTKRRFWVASLAVPVAVALLFTVVLLSNQTTDKTSQEQKNAQFSFTYTDASGLVTDAVASRFGGTKASDGTQAIADVKAGTVQAYFAFPADPATEPVHVYGVDSGVFDNGKYSAVARQILITGAQEKIGSPTLTKVAQGNVSVTEEMYKSGQLSSGLNGVIPPMLFLLIFYVSIILLGNQMLNSTLEEKENRVTEMILTTMNPTTLIVGKVISLFLVGLVQMATFAVPVIVGYVFFRQNLNLPNLDLSHLTFDPQAMIVGFLLLIGGFILFTGTLVAIGAVVPTVKEAGAFFGPMMIMIFIPFYVVSLIVSDPGAAIVQVLTYFPYTAPVTAMLRNGLGSLSLLESCIVLVEVFGIGFLALRVAVRLFRYGSISYSSKLSVRTALRRADAA